MQALRVIQQLLEENDFSCHLAAPTSTVPYERLLLAWEPNLPELAQDLIEITAQPLQQPEEIQKGEKEASYFLIQFQSICSFDVPASTIKQVSTALHFFNRLLHCPGFELDELNDQVLFRYVWYVSKQGLEAPLLIQIIGSIQLCIKLFSPSIKGLAEGEYTLEEILEKVVQLSKLHEK